MPVTPLHWGPALLIGLLAIRYLDFPTLMASSVIPDLRTALVFFGLINGPAHGSFTSYTVGTVVALALAVLVIPVRDNSQIVETLELLGLDQRIGKLKIIAASLLGVYTHVTLDSMLYTDATPLYPSSINPLLGILSTGQVYLLCVVALIAGFFAYLGILIRHELNS